MRTIRVLLATVALVCVSAQAVVYEKKTFPELAVEADQIVVGTVTSATSRMTLRGRIVTDFRFEELEIVKGNLGPIAHLDIMLAGGTVGIESQEAIGAPEFKMGVRYVLFVKDNGRAIFPLVGGSQGIFQLRSSGSDYAVFNYGGGAVSELRGRDGAILVKSAGASQEDPLSKDAFLSAVRSAMAGNR